MALDPVSSVGFWGTQTGGVTAEDLSGPAADYRTWIPGFPITIYKLGFVVTTTIAADTTAPVVSFDRRITAGSDTGRVEIGTITVADTVAAGKTVVEDLATPVILGLGEELVFEHKTQAADGSAAAGAGHYFVVYQPLAAIDTSDANYVAAP